MSQCIQQYAFVLHVRPIADNKIIVELLSEQDGRLSVVCRIPNRDKKSFSLQPFRKLLVQIGAGSGLRTLISFENAGLIFNFQGLSLFCGFYLNELLSRVLPQNDPNTRIFESYCSCLEQLAVSNGQEMCESALRHFEFFLLEDMGVLVDFNHCVETGLPILPDGSYRLDLNRGFYAVVGQPNLKKGVFLGEDLLRFSQRSFDTSGALSAAKVYTRLTLATILGDKPLRSRELFSPPKH